MKKNSQLLEKACRTWLEAESFRKNRERLKKYTFGEQWNDMVKDFNNNPMPEYELMRRGGKRPVTNNLIRRIVRILVGRYRTDAVERNLYDLRSGSLHSRNALPELDARLFEEFIISGCAVQRIVAEKRPLGTGVWIDNVDPRHFFVNPYSDPRGGDITMIGMYHDMAWTELVNRFACGSRSRLRRLEEIFRTSPPDPFTAYTRTVPGSILIDPAPTGAGKLLDGNIRIMEVWTLEPVAVRSSLHYDLSWRCRFIAPDGTVLLDSPSDFPHGSHPFVVKFYPLIDGEVHPFIEDLVDRQRAINRMLTTFEATMAASAKGCLLFPVDQMPPGCTYEDIGRLWARPDSVIPILGRGFDAPQQMIVNNTATGIVPLIEMQLKLFEETSGISDTLAGTGIAGSVGTEIYKTILANARASVADLLESFRSFIDARDAKAALTLRKN